MSEPADKKSPVDHVILRRMAAPPGKFSDAPRKEHKAMSNDTDLHHLLIWLDQLHDADMRACQTRTGGKLDDYFFGCSGTFRKMREKVSKLIVAGRNPAPTPTAPRDNPAAAVLATLAGVFDKMAEAERMADAFPGDAPQDRVHLAIGDRFRATAFAIRTAAQDLTDQDTAP